MIVDLAGQRFGRLTVLGLAPRDLWKSHHAYWMVECDCGNGPWAANSNHLRRGDVRSCGCYRNDNPGHLKHGMSSTPEYKAWSSMIYRCTNPNSSAYQHYGGRGIEVYEGWKTNFQEFYDYIGPKPSPEYTLDRIDTDGNYEPGNVQWASKSWQTKDQRRSPNIVS